VPCRIAPSVLNADLSALAGEVDRVAAVADLIHLDVMDGHFVPNLTFGLPVIESILARTTVPADCHLMIDDPDRWAPGYAEVGAFSVTFHIEAARDPLSICRDLHRHGARAGVAIKPGTPVDALAPCLNELDMIAVMCVEPGFGGQAFMPDMLSKIKEARALAGQLGPDIWVQVDGGIDERTIAQAAAAGADCFVAGSAVYRSEDPAAAVQHLREIAEHQVSP